jgi:hypothetical protein
MQQFPIWRAENAARSASGFLDQISGELAEVEELQQGELHQLCLWHRRQPPQQHQQQLELLSC